MRMDQPTIQRLHLEASYLLDAIREKAQNSKNETIKSGLEIAADHLYECASLLRVTRDLALKSKAEPLTKEDYLDDRQTKGKKASI